MNEDGVSVCIPTLKRPEMVRECIASVFLNAARPLEIIVSDHDFGSASQAAIASIQVPDAVTLRHVAGPEELTQSANVNSLLQLATYERVVLLHDDDLLTPGALDRMTSAWDQFGGELDALYGRQYISDASGAIDTGRTEANDRYYFKKAEPGIQPSALWSALVGQFPNDGMMMRKSLALQVRYPTEAEVGKLPVDFHFGIRYAQAASRPFVLLVDYLAIYRRSEDSIERSTRTFYDGQFGYEHLEQLSGLTATEEQGRQLALARFAGSAVMGYLAAGKAKLAARVLRRHLHELDKKWSVRLALIALTAAEGVGLPILTLKGIKGRRF